MNLDYSWLSSLCTTITVRYIDMRMEESGGDTQLLPDEDIGITVP